MKKWLSILLFLSFLTPLVSCAEDDDLPIPQNMGNKETESDKVPDGTEEFYDKFEFANYSANSFSNQSAAAFNDYLFLVPKYRGIIYLYSLKEKKFLCACTMKAMKEVNGSGNDVYHCNQTCFGTDYYDIDDPFPLLYISQRARSDKRCFTEVFRITAEKSAQDNEYSSFKLELVQTIYYPPMTEANSLGNVNTVIDRDNSLLYTYSRNNTKEDANYRQCKITCFAIPDIRQKEVYLEDIDIKKSFMLDISAYFMQGACIEGDYLCIARGATSVGYIDVNIVNLKTQKMVRQLDLLHNGYRWEPEGCFFYNGQLMISSSSNIWKLDNVSGIVDISDEQVAKTYYYNTDGIQLYAPQKGINIVRCQTNDGTKVIRKVYK